MNHSLTEQFNNCLCIEVENNVAGSRDVAEAENGNQPGAGKNSKISYKLAQQLTRRALIFFF